MKYFFTILAFFAFVGISFTQAPQGINYQGVARNADTSPKSAGTSITIGFKIKDAFGTDLYTETQTKQTNGIGLFTAVIGQGTPVSGSFANIPWGSGPKFLEVTVDGQNSGQQQLMSVPYALYAEKTNIQAGNGIGVNGNTITNTGDNDNNPTNEIQTLSVSGNQLSISGNGGNTVTLPTGTTSSNALSNQQNVGFESNVRNSWLDMDNLVQVTVPTAGKYIVLASLRVTNFTDEDRPYFRVVDVVTGGSTRSVIMSGFDGENDVESSNFAIMQLGQNTTLRLQGRLDPLSANNPAVNQVIFQEGKLAIIKIE